MYEGQGSGNCHSTGDGLDLPRMGRSGHVDLVRYLKDEAYPRLKPEQLFAHPSHSFNNNYGNWRGGCPWHYSDTGSAFAVYPDTLTFHCFNCEVGGDPINYLYWLETGDPHVGAPSGDNFTRIVGQLCDLAGVPFPSREMSPEARARHAARKQKEAVLTATYAWGQEVLASKAGVQARAYLMEVRGLKASEIRELNLGYYLTVSSLRERLIKDNCPIQVAEEAGLLLPHWEGHLLFPWRDDRGRPLSIYGRWAGEEVPEGAKRTLSMRGSGTKRVPMYLDRALTAGHKDLVLVEGQFDAALPQVRGCTQTVCLSGKRLTAGQLGSLSKSGILTATICFDGDDAGRRGTTTCIKDLMSVGIKPYVAELPDGQDPADYVREEGVRAWGRLLDEARPGHMYLAGELLGDIATNSPELKKERAVRAVAELLTDDIPQDQQASCQEDIQKLVEEKTGYSKAKFAEALAAGGKDEEWLLKTFGIEAVKRFEIEGDKESTCFSLQVNGVWTADITTKELFKPLEVNARVLQACGQPFPDGCLPKKNRAVYWEDNVCPVICRVAVAETRKPEASPKMEVRSVILEHLASADEWDGMQPAVDASFPLRVIDDSGDKVWTKFNTVLAAVRKQIPGLRDIHRKVAAQMEELGGEKVSRPRLLGPSGSKEKIAGNAWIFETHVLQPRMEVIESVQNACPTRPTH